MANLFNLSEEEKNRIRGLHLVESKNLRFTSVLNEAGTPPGDDKCFTVNFNSGGSTIDKMETGDIGIGNLLNQIYQGMLSDRPFIDIEVGVSGPGSVEDNEVVMNKRISAALDYLISKMGGIKGPTGLRYSAEALKNKSIINKVYGTEEAGSILDTGERIPTDPTDEYFKGSQYVKICFNLAGETPGYGSLADQFMAVTMEKTGTDEDAVYSILDQLRDAEDFREFNDELKRDYDMDFYEVACDSISVDLNPLWPGETEGPSELGMEDTTINAHLRRLGVAPINC